MTEAPPHCEACGILPDGPMLAETLVLVEAEYMDGHGDFPMEWQDIYGEMHGGAPGEKRSMKLWLCGSCASHAARRPLKPPWAHTSGGKSPPRKE